MTGTSPPTDIATDDLVLPFQIGSSDIHGRLVTLAHGVDGVLGSHDYPEPVAKLLGELVVVSAAAAGAFKFRGMLSLHTSSDGPVPMMIAEYRAPGGDDPRVAPAALRGYARFDAEKVVALGQSELDKNPVAALLGSGHLAITIDPGAGGERYQGVTALEGSTLVECMHGYLRQSEQFDAALRVDVSRTGGDGTPWRASGVMVQRLPKKGAPFLDRENEDWFHVLALIDSMDGAALLEGSEPQDTVLKKIFPKEPVRAYRPVRVDSLCRCSRDKVDMMLHSFSPEDRKDMLEDGKVTVTCEFCASTYVFEADQLERPSRTSAQ
jgi:molecular chaperone Hsp33